MITSNPPPPASRPSSAPLGDVVKSLKLDGHWLFRTHGALRSHEATLALRLRLDDLPRKGRAGLLDGDIWREGVLRLQVDESGRFCAQICSQTRELCTAPLITGKWAWLAVTFSRKSGAWSLDVFPAGHPHPSNRPACATIEGAAGIDFDTLTIGGPRLAGTREALQARLADVIVSSRAWTEAELAALGASGVCPDADALHWNLEDIPSEPARLSHPMRSQDRTLQGRELRKDSTAGEGGSRGSIGAFVYRADLAQPEPPARITDEDFTALGIHRPERAMISETPSWSWETALPCGNGEQGALVLGRPLDEVIVLNRAGLFLPLHPPIPPPRQGDQLPALRALLAQGRFQDAADHLMQFSADQGYSGEKRWTDPFVPAGFLQINTPDAGPCTHYLRGIDYQTGTVAVRWRDGTGWHLRETFVSRADDVVVVRISGAPGTVCCSLNLAAHDARAALAGENPPDAVGQIWSKVETDWLGCEHHYANRWPRSLKASQGLARVIVRGGRQEAAPGFLHVTNADEVMLLIRTVRVFDGLEHPDLRTDLAALTGDFATLKARHAAAHGALWNRTRLRVGGSDTDHRLPTERLFEHSRIGALNPALMEKAFDACRHLALSSSGRLFPPTLQGMWGGTWEPSWSGDYTQNGNLQCAIDGHLPGNMHEAMEGYFNYLERQLDEYRLNARHLFNARGILIPSRTSSHGLLNHFDETWPMPFWVSGAAWNARYFYDYWLYTGDRDFLRRRAIPFMREAALFYEDILVPGADGRLHFSPSYSPENDSPATGSQSCTDATMDHAAARELLTNLLTACRQERVHSESWPRWQDLRDRLLPYRITTEGCVAEWIDPRLTDRHEHRHASHLYALYQGLPDDIAGNAALRAAFARTIETKMKPRREAGGGIMGFGMVQLGAPAASLRLGETAFETVDWLTHNFWIPQSMVTTHNPRSVFNTDITGGLARIVLLMLADSQPGWIELLPAAPSAWPEGVLEGIRCRGAVVIERLAWSPERVTAVLCSRETQCIELRLARLSAAGFSGAPPTPGLCGWAKIILPAGKPVSVELIRAA